MNLKKMYKEYNDSIFLGALSTPKIKIKKLTRKKHAVYYTLYGLCVYYPDEPTIKRIELDKCLLNDEYNLRCTLLHEMIHQAEWEIFRKEPKHKKRFKKLAKIVSEYTEIPIEDIF